MQRMPLVPEEELLASSRRHPLHPAMTWLLHTRRVPTLPPHAGAEQPSPLTGDPDQPVWMCVSCAASLCRRPKSMTMPPYALANLLWLGREPPCYQGLTLGARLLLSKGRPCWRKLILGRGAEEDLQKGISGNTILLAQARPQAQDICPPRTEDVQESLVVLFAKSINDVRGAQALMVDKAKYLECLRLRKRVCAEFADVLVDEAAIAAWPAAGVPAAIMACAQALPEAASLRAREDGPGRVRGAVHAREDALGVDAEEEAVADEEEQEEDGQEEHSAAEMPEDGD